MKITHTAVYVGANRYHKAPAIRLTLQLPKIDGEKLVKDYVDSALPEKKAATPDAKDAKDAGAADKKEAPKPAAAGKDAGPAAPSPLKQVHEVITERMLRAPKPSFVYSIRIEP